MGLATNADFATEVTLQPLARYALDAAILFSDILSVPDAMGLGLGFAEGEGPRFAHPVQSEADVAALAVPDMAKLRYVFDAVASIRRALAGKVPLIGFAGSPWTLACYMVEGRGSDDYRLVKTRGRHSTRRAPPGRAVPALQCRNAARRGNLGRAQAFAFAAGRRAKGCVQRPP